MAVRAEEIESRDITVGLGTLAPTVPMASDWPTTAGVVTGLRCSRQCRGNIYLDLPEHPQHPPMLVCMLCGRTPRHIRVARPQAVPRAGYGEAQRNQRAQSREQGSTGMAARILSEVPEAPSYTTAWAIGRPMRISTEEVRIVLSGLVERGLVEQFVYEAGVTKRPSLGYRRPVRH